MNLAALAELLQLEPPARSLLAQADSVPRHMSVAEMKYVLMFVVTARIL